MIFGNLSKSVAPSAANQVTLPDWAPNRPGIASIRVPAGCPEAVVMLHEASTLKELAQFNIGPMNPAPTPVVFVSTEATVTYSVAVVGNGTLPAGASLFAAGDANSASQLAAAFAITPSGGVAVAGAIYSDGLSPGSVGGTLPTRGLLAAIGTSTIGNATSVTANGVTVRNDLSIWDRVNDSLHNRYTVQNFGYSGTNNATLIDRLRDTVLPLKPAIVALHWSSNDLPANDMAAAETAFQSCIAAVAECRAAGALPIIVTPHLQTDVANKWPTLVAYDAKCQEWGINNNVLVVSGAYSIAANTDKLGTAKANTMGDTLHINALGCTYYVDEVLRVVRGEISWRLLGGGNVEWAGQLVLNPRCTGSGAASGTGITGTRCANISPSRFAGTPTCVCSVGTDAEGAYMDLEIAFAAADDGIQVPEFITLARYLDGKTYVGMCDFEVISGAFVRGVVLQHNFASGAINEPAGSLAARALPVGRRQIRSPYYTKAQTAPAVDTQHRAIIYGYAAGTSVVRMRAIGCRETVV